MKKFIIIAAAAGFLLAGCAIDDGGKLSQTKTPQQITFSNPVVSPNTRTHYGEIDGNKYPTDETFNVYACRSDHDFTGWTSDEIEGANLYMNNVMVKHDATLGAWAPEKPYLWPEEGDKLTFAAYSPTAAKELSTIKYGKTGFTFEDFTVSSLAEQYDLMYSERTYNKTSSEGGTSYSGVDIKFHHALSSIHFKVKTDIEYAQEFKVKSITLNGILSQATFTEGIDEANPGVYKASPQWSSWHSPAAYEFNYPLVLTASYQQMVANEATAAILIPQEFAEGSDPSITVSWSLAGIDQTPVSVKLSNIKFTTPTSDGSDPVPAAEWKMGYRYTYNLIFTSSTGGPDGKDRRIFFSPEVDKWENATQVPNPGTDVKPGNDGKIL